MSVNNTKPLRMGTVVTVNVADMLIHGEIAGRANSGISELYIIRCTDGQLPNDFYPYDTFAAQLRFIIDVNAALSVSYFL